MACERCQSLCAREAIRTPSVYRDLIRRLIDLVGQRELRLIDGVPLEPLLIEGAKWPSDGIEHTFECLHCGQRFKMFVDTYHGRGGDWRAAE